MLPFGKSSGPCRFGGRPPGNTPENCTRGQARAAGIVVTKQAPNHLPTSVQSLDRRPITGQHLRVLIDAQPAEGERDSAGYWLGPKRWSIKGLRPVAFTRCESFSFQPIVHCRVKGCPTDGSVVGSERFFQSGLTSRQLVD